ncbi:hypothetical protein SCMU_26490 [Sinomonas cyclohexanicum]|uniref:Uncharacterized protein n=1 Tax=Sinomonas cyclohexanicum TaxID=322009 RepID=A0ABM7PWY7_SINCY|nr:hypothetical protein SCMU_26490 [Corynebacterium cyclohexanicum]
MGPPEAAEPLEDVPPDGPVHAVSASREAPASAMALRTADVVFDIDDLLLSSRGRAWVTLAPTRVTRSTV